MEDCLAFKPSNRPTFAEVVKRITTMQQELRNGRPVTGVAAKQQEEGGIKGRLFRDRAKVPPHLDFLKEIQTMDEIPF